MSYTLTHIRDLPDWVRRWRTARAAGDFRLFPEQAEGVRSLHFNHGHPLGEMKTVGFPSGYERECVVATTKPLNDREFWVQPDEFVT